MVKLWGDLDPSKRKQMKQAYNDAGIKVVMSVFGGTDFPTTQGADPTSTAKTMGRGGLVVYS